MIISELFEGPQLCPECGGISFSDLILAEKKDACYHKVKASAKVWPSAYASGRLVQCRKKGASNYGNKSEGVAEGTDQINEYRNRLLQYVKGLLPTWPEYVLKDWLVPNKGDFSNLPDNELKNGIMEKLNSAGLTPNTKWQLVPNMKFTMDMFNPMSKKRLIGRAGGHSDMGLDVPRDKERHATQAALARQQGGIRKEPVILIQTPQGYALLEGWHRTIQHFAMYPDGYTGPAYIAVAQGQQGVAEEQELDEKWSQKYKSSINCANPKGFSQKAHCAGRNKNESIAEAPAPGQRRGPLDLPPLEGPGSGGGSQVPQFRLPIIPDNMPGGARMPGGAGMSRNIATQRSVGGKEIPSLGQPGKVVTSPTADRALTKVGGKNVSTTTGPAVTVQKRGSEYEPLAADVPAYVRKGLPDPVTVPKPGTKPKITVRPGETVPQAMQRTRDEQEFSSFLKGQGGQSFGTPGAGRGGQGGPTAAQTSGSNQVPTIKLPGGQTIPDPARLSPSGQYNTQSKPNSEMDKIMQKWDKEQQSAPSSSSKSKTSPSKFLQLFGPDKMDEESRKKREKPEVDYDDEYDAMVARVKKLAGLGPMRTVYDPKKRQYRNMPTAVQPKK